ncbi:uncharacterized protein MKK02DRAFT_41306 [Dioszegia hungarica]|uniref:Uncharacterized protein n=1 Tax=Dioszegia hungarica TaxID=4972 RepID=A0AA38H020_9TREE|nr:uncharacterized protein MKK02DRAFT_41306 [Dioszegia hungarica]KAI9632162.1 hypothetical protein MKK02DRAFT_41306 [Dioszegia hungarica]
MRGSITYAETVLKLVDAAHRLQIFEADLQHELLPAWEDAGLPTMYTRLPWPASFVDLRFAFGDHITDGEDGHKAIYALLCDCLFTRQLAFRFDELCPSVTTAIGNIVDYAGEWEELEHVHFQGRAKLFMEEVKRRQGERRYQDHVHYLFRFAETRMLILDTTDLMLDLFQYIPTWPKLETLHFNRIPISAPPSHFGAQTVCSPLPVQSMTPALASNLRGSPHLRHLSFGPSLVGGQSFDDFDRLRELDENGQSTGFVYSYHHGGAEILHMRLNTNFIQHTDTPSTAPTNGAGEAVAPPAGSFHYQDAEDGWRIRSFVAGPEAVWQDWTDVNGGVVPLEVLEEMRVAEGRKDTEWRKRGVEVGETGWAVLLAWMAGREGEA